ncbi:MAG: amidohydrolase family protein [Candidatus Hydrogenedentes bacterium]|nr:amidohydrolase family protein [Candidatus Hydrogenedentota bacterium]
MSSYDGDPREEHPRLEPTLKDALMPARPPKKPDGVRVPEPASRNEARGGAAPSLQDALLPKDHHPPAPPQSSADPATAAAPAPTAAGEPLATGEAVAPSNAVQWIVAAAIGLGFLAVFALSWQRALNPVSGEAIAPLADAAPVDPAEPIEAANPGPDPSVPNQVWPFQDPGPMSLAQIQEKRLIVDVHEHIESLEEAPKFLAAMDKLGIQRICLMGSSKFTLTLDESVGFTGYDENNEELIKIIKAYPDRFEAWPTINPEDPEKLPKIQDLVARGATGVKLYTGHGYICRDHSYMFHPIAMDHPDMMSFYAWCEANYVPIVLHVNPFKEKKGFAQEFIAILTQFPDLKVVAPHFILSSVYSARMEELLDTFPNLYSDIGFGDYFMAERIDYISRYPEKFTRLLTKYQDRFFFASDLVMIKGRADDWAVNQMQAYIDILTAEEFTSPAIPGKSLKGLKLPDEIVSKILFRNYWGFRASRPQGTQITRKIDWSRMNQEPVDREPGQAFPPPPK